MKRFIIAIFTLLCLAACGNKKDGIQTISVSNGLEFLRALGSDRVIVLQQGEYELSESAAVIMASGKVNEGVDLSDGVRLKNIHNLTIRSADNIAKYLVTANRLDYVLYFEDCSNIVLENFFAGHIEGGECAGGVFRFERSSQITIDNMDMYGCGTEGLMLVGVTEVLVKNSRIFDCNRSILYFGESSNITVENCVFTNNVGNHYGMVIAFNSVNISLKNCLFSNNNAENIDHTFFYLVASAMSVQDSKFVNNRVKTPIENDPDVTFIYCDFNYGTEVYPRKFDEIISIKVLNGKDFIKALGSDRIIYVYPGVYDLKKDFEDLQRDGTVQWLSSEVTDGTAEDIPGCIGVFITGVKNLTIRGMGSQGRPQILTSEAYAFVLNFVRCEDITIENITAGHIPEGECMGGVFRFMDSSRIKISDSGMFGCGTTGLYLYNVYDLQAENSSIYECNISIMEVYSSQAISFTHCVFEENRGATMVHAENSDLSINNSTFHNNISSWSHFFNAIAARVIVANSSFINNVVDYAIEDCEVLFSNCEIK
jgi:hypothetical protein